MDGLSYRATALPVLRSLTDSPQFGRGPVTDAVLPPIGVVTKDGIALVHAPSYKITLHLHLWFLEKSPKLKGCHNHTDPLYVIVYIGLDPSCPELNHGIVCGNNPLVYVDPSGHWFGIDDAIAAIVGAIVGGISSAINGGNILEGAATGAAAGWVGWNTLGTVGAVGGKLLGATAAGATSGAVSGGMGAAFNGGNVGQGMLTGAAYGAATGAVTCGLKSFATSGFQPFGSGTAAGIIGNRLVNSAVVGGVVGAGYAVVSGDNVLKGAAMGAGFWAAGEAANMMIGNGIGYALSGQGPEVRNGAFYYSVNKQVPFTIGGAIIGDSDWLLEPNTVNRQPDYGHTVEQHEFAHFPQQTLTSAAYIPLHALSLGLGGLIGSFTSGGFLDGTHRYNLFERWLIEIPAY